MVVLGWRVFFNGAVRLTLLWVGSSHEGINFAEELPGDEPFEAAPYFTLGLSLFRASLDVVLRGRIESRPAAGDGIDGLVGA